MIIFNGTRFWEAQRLPPVPMALVGSSPLWARLGGAWAGNVYIYIYFNCIADCNALMNIISAVILKLLLLWTPLYLLWTPDRFYFIWVISINIYLKLKLRNSNMYLLIYLNNNTPTCIFMKNFFPKAKKKKKSQ